jgi:protein phosphatase
VVSVQASAVHYTPARPFPPGGTVPPDPRGPQGGTVPPDPRGPSTSRPQDVLDIRDVTSTRGIETAYLARVSVREGNAAAALEVMSRFAIDPRWLWYLPPTMSPVAASARPDVLEHPAEAFSLFRADGVQAVVCEEKHMGSRAVLLVTGEGGALWTRTGRSFFDAALTDVVLDRVRAAATKTGLFGELGASWLLLDTEVMPWNVKAAQLLRDQYAAVGAAASASLQPALLALSQAASRGLPVDDLLDRTRSRAGNADAFIAAYRRYCWPVDGLDGVRIAPFQLLASDGAVYHERPHLWHLALADRLAAADPALIATTRRLLVDLADPESEAAATAWWETRTAAGAEGMVVKPADGLVRGTRGIVQPALKVRGREYLRIIYGPDYLEPANLTRLRQRALGHKRSLALREYALGLEALDRVAHGEPLWRIHECVFAVLALESEPVDPRL